MKRFRFWNFNADPSDPDLQGGGGDNGTPDPAPSDEGSNQGDVTFPDNWREVAAGEDEKLLGYLSRYASPRAAFEGGLATKMKLSSGEYRSTEPFPENGDEDAQNAWREQNGIPLAPDAYKFEGQEFTEEDKQFLSEFQEYAHKNNIPNSQAEAFVKYLVEFDEKETEQTQARDKELVSKAEDELRLEWQGDFRRNWNLINSYLDTAPEGVKDALLKGRLADGTPITANPDVMRFLVDSALQINPVATVVPNANGNVMNSIDDEIASIEKMMRENSKAYYKDDKIQQRYRDLLTAKERAK